MAHRCECRPLRVLLKECGVDKQKDSNESSKSRKRIWNHKEVARYLKWIRQRLSVIGVIVVKLSEPMTEIIS